MTDYDELRSQRMSAVSNERIERMQGTPNLAIVGVEGMRAGMAANLGRMPAVPGVTTRDVNVDALGGPIPVRIHTPPNESDAKLPVVLNIHFGGFVAAGGLDIWNGYDSALAVASGAIVVHPDFRLPPEHRFPAGLEDNWAVLNWIVDAQAEQGWDASRLAVGGGCSGGNMAAVLSLMARDAGGPAIALQYLDSFPADLRNDTASQYENADGYGLRKSDNDFVTSQYLAHPEDRWDWRASPLFADSVAGVAPAIVTVGEWDILRDEDLQYANRLRDAGVPVELHLGEQEGHIPSDPIAHMRRIAAAIRHAFAT